MITTPVADDIFQARLSLPFALRIVNCYLLKDGSGWTILDTGINTPHTQQAWQAVFEELQIDPCKVRRIIITHAHLDHYGAAGWLQAFCTRNKRQETPPVFMSAREIELARIFWQRQNGLRETIHQFFQSCGLPKHLYRTVAGETGKLWAATFPIPEVLMPLQAGAKIQIGNRELEVIHTPGHSDGHLVFYDRNDRLLLCGDQVLNEITPNISIWPLTEPDPLGRYLDSLDRLGELEVRIALPGHRTMITNWQQRLNELKEHHDERLENMYQAVNSNTSVYEVAAQEFELDKLSSYEIRFAVTETLAHLEYLVREGKLIRDERKMRNYRKA